jgi:tRNA dimethylallyltransferase
VQNYINTLKNNYLITVVGPTAIGKTSVAIALAQYFNCEIISCDSRQFYKEMNIGTAVPSIEELASVPHHFIQHISIHHTYNVGDYEREALDLLDQLFLKNNVQILVGGSGLYVDAVLKGFDDFPIVSEDVLQEIKNNYNDLGINYLQNELKILDEFYFNFLTENNPQTLQNPQRLIRFVSVCKSSNLPYSSFLNQSKNTRNFIPIIIGLEAEKDIIYQRINQRVEVMLKNGLLKEAESLFQFKELNALQTVGYREIFQFFENDKTLDESIENIKMNTRRFAKRQMTWFRKTENIIWFHFNANIKDIVKKIECLLSSH